MKHKYLCPKVMMVRDTGVLGLGQEVTPLVFKELELTEEEYKKLENQLDKYFKKGGIRLGGIKLRK